MEKNLYNGEYFIQTIQWEDFQTKPIHAKAINTQYSAEALNLLKE